MKINVHSAIGHPDDPKTWSGTPCQIVRELRQQGKLGDIFLPEQASRANWLLRRLLSAYYGRVSPYRIGGLLGWTHLRTHIASVLARNLQQAASPHTLHFGTLGLPFRQKPAGQYQYLYTDGVWNLWARYSPDVRHYPPQLIQRIDRLEQAAYNQMDHIFSISDYVKDNLVQHYRIAPEKITVVGSGTGVIQPYTGQKDYRNGKILFAAKGRFADKGGQLVLEAFQKALEKRPGLELTIVGQNDYTNQICHPRIKTYGFIPIEELQHIFNTHSLFLMPALNEPWGLVYIEAMLCKMPIVGLNRNSFPELSGYGSYGKGVAEPDAEALAGIICDFFDNPVQMEETGKQAQAHVLQQYTWQQSTDRIIRIIEQMAQKKGSEQTG